MVILIIYLTGFVVAYFYFKYEECGHLFSYTAAWTVEDMLSGLAFCSIWPLLGLIVLCDQILRAAPRLARLYKRFINLKSRI